MSTLIDVRLFGALELKSQHGCLVENKENKPSLFLLLKYLLLEPKREADQEEVLRLVWSDKTMANNAVRVRLHRLREMLEPLQPEGGKSLITFRAGKYGLEPNYTLRFDTDAFLALLKKIDTYPLNDPEGLKLCQEALALFRGPLMEDTEDAIWLAGYRIYYQREFIRLGHETLKRMRAQGNTNAVKLLCTRAAVLTPEDETLQKELISFLANNQMEEELAQHMRLLEHTGKAAWLKTIAQTNPVEQAEIAPITGGENMVLVRLFGDVELRNEHGHIVENRSRTPLLLLKYLLIKHPKDITIDEILQLWPVSKAGVNPESTVAVRLRRAREALRPLQLDKKEGLIYYREGVFRLNPVYTLKRDIDIFEELVGKLTDYAVDNPNGLQLCMEAMELFRGPLMEYTKSSPWLEEYRCYYRNEFCRLASDALNRIRALKSDEALTLLAQRAVVIAPEYQDLHESIIRYLLEQKRELELIRYLSQLARSGKANWMEESFLTP